MRARVRESRVYLVLDQLRGGVSEISAGHFGIRRLYTCLVRLPLRFTSPTPLLFVTISNMMVLVSL
jgi:hypothetical protein